MEKLVSEMSVREYDEHCEKAMAQFLDEYFYKEIGFSWKERVTDRERQIKGLDVILKRNDIQYNIDEKAAIRYTNGLRTFSLELSFLDRGGKRRDGWLIDEKKVNDYYVFVWINKIDGELIENKDSFKDVDVALVSKEKIMFHLESLGWDVDKLFLKDERIRDGIDTKLGDIKKNGCKFVYSEHLREKPINVLLPKETYINISESHRRIQK
jgi:hypothetical protein